MFMSSEGISGSTPMNDSRAISCSPGHGNCVLDMHAGNAVRAMSGGGFERIKVDNPVVDLDGDEMTRCVVKHTCCAWQPLLALS
jgi:hypothetical protein